MRHPPLTLRPNPLPVLLSPVQRQGRRSFAPRCDIRQAKGRRFDADAVNVGSPVGEGSFGQVFQVSCATTS